MTARDAKAYPLVRRERRADGHTDGPDRRGTRRVTLDGKYWASFNINSRNYRQVPKKTHVWFDDLSRLLVECVELARRDRRGLARQCFLSLFEVMQRAYSNGDVVFADEYGNWMLSM